MGRSGSAEPRGAKRPGARPKAELEVGAGGALPPRGPGYNQFLGGRLIPDPQLAPLGTLLIVLILIILIYFCIFTVFAV
jgi:hypothetical protein